MRNHRHVLRFPWGGGGGGGSTGGIQVPGNYGWKAINYDAASPLGNQVIAAGGTLNFNGSAGGTRYLYDDIGHDTTLSAGWGIAGAGLTPGSRFKYSVVVGFSALDSANPPYMFADAYAATVQPNGFDMVIQSPALIAGNAGFPTDDYNVNVSMNSIQISNPAAAASSATVVYAYMIMEQLMSA